MSSRHYPDLSSASDCSCRVDNLLQSVRSTTQIWVNLAKLGLQFGISALASQTSFRGETSVLRLSQLDASKARLTAHRVIGNFRLVCTLCTKYATFLETLWSRLLAFARCCGNMGQTIACVAGAGKYLGSRKNGGAPSRAVFFLAPTTSKRLLGRSTKIVPQCHATPYRPSLTPTLKCPM